MRIALIGNTGLIGRHIKKFVSVDAEYNSKNIKSIQHQKFDLIYCAAPSGNRLAATKNIKADTQSIDLLIDCLRKVETNKIILISTSDTQISPDSIYGYNRLRLAEFVKENFNDHHIIKLSALISDSITKNILYDIKNSIYIDKINANTISQWYPLCDLKKDLDRIVKYNIKETNLCSEPISVQEMIDAVAPQINDKILKHTPGANYNLTPYSHTKEDIFKYMREYLK